MYSLLVATVGAIVIGSLGHPLETIFLSFIGGVEPFILIAVPLFIFAGEILSSGGIGQRIVNFARALLGFLPGGLGVVTVASCLMFGGVSGSAIADTAAIGSLVIPSMLKRGYSRGFAAALLAVAGTLALLMPLSIPFLVYAFISGVSMRQLSMAGLVPGLVMAVALIGVCIWYGRKSGCDSGDVRATRARDLGHLQGRGSGADDAVDHRRRHLVGGLHADRVGGGGRGLRHAGLAVPLSGHHRARPAAAAGQRLPDQRHGDAGDRRDRRAGLADHRRAGGRAAGGLDQGGGQRSSGRSC